MPITNDQNLGKTRFEFFSFWSFEFVSNFGFRASNFSLIIAIPSTWLRTCLARVISENQDAKEFANELAHPAYLVG